MNLIIIIIIIIIIIFKNLEMGFRIH